MYHNVVLFLIIILDIFNKLKKDELNLNILHKLLDILKQIEKSELDQHEGAFEVGKLLKAMYIDSASNERQRRIDKKTGKKTTSVSKPKEKENYLGTI